MDEEERRLHAQAMYVYCVRLCDIDLNYISPYLRHPPGMGTDANPPDLDAHRHSAFESSGRGGAGNIRSRSVSRDPNGRTPSRDAKEKHGIAALWSKVSHPSSPGSGDGGPRQE